MDRGRQLLAGDVAAVLVAVFGWCLIAALYALAGTSLAVAGVYLALGRFEEGVAGSVAALLVVGLGALAGALASGLYQGAAGALTVSLQPSATSLQSGDMLTLGVAVQGTPNPVRLTVDWGDGTLDTYTVEPGTLYRLNHTYRVPGGEAVATYSITVEAVDVSNPGVWGRNVVVVVVQNQEYCPLGWPFSVLCGLYRLVSYVLPAVDLQKLVACPTLPLREGDPVYGVYTTVLGAAMGGLGLFLAFSAVWCVATGASPLAIVETFRDVVVAVALALLAPYAYNATANILNLVSYTQG